MRQLERANKRPPRGGSSFVIQSSPRRRRSSGLPRVFVLTAPHHADKLRRSCERALDCSARAANLDDSEARRSFSLHARLWWRVAGQNLVELHDRESTAEVPAQLDSCEKNIDAAPFGQDPSLLRRRPHPSSREREQCRIAGVPDVHRRGNLSSPS